MSGNEATTAQNSPHPASTLPGPLQALADKAPSLARVIQFGWRLGERWGLDRCPIIAAALAFFGLLSLFPIVLAALAILGDRLASNPGELEAFLRFLRQFLPGETGTLITERVQGQIETVSTSPAAITVRLVSIASLLWSGRAYFDTLASVLNSIWPNAQPRTFVQHQLALWGTIIGAGLLFLLSSAASLGLSLVQRLNEHLPDLFINRQPLLWQTLAWLVSWLLTVLMFWTIYRFLPNARPGGRGRIALGCALVASIGWELAKWAFSRFLPDATSYGAVYGSVAGIVLTMMWLYFSSLIVLLGAESGAAYLETKAAAKGEAKPTQDKPEDRGVALPDTGPAAAPEPEVAAKKQSDQTQGHG